MTTIGVLGAGTMGSGVAQVVAMAGLDVMLYDVSRAQLDRALQVIRGYLQRSVERGRLTAAEAEAVFGHIRPITTLGSISSCEVVIEAAPESLDLKRQIFSELDKVCNPAALLATNTSSLSITEIGSLTTRPERVVGLHFFNPPALMALVEIIRGHKTAPETVQRTLELARRLGKTPVLCQDTPGFIVNRCARPFYLEGLRLLQEGVAPAEAIDRICRLGARFRLGPFELMDLVGIDVNFAVSQSVYSQFFDESRYRPSPIQQRMVQAGLFGRKNGKGFYTYENGQPLPAAPEADAAALASGGRLALGGATRVLVLGHTPLAETVAANAASAGLSVSRWPADGTATAVAAADVVVDATWLPLARRREVVADAVALHPDALLLADASDASATQLGAMVGGSVVGFGLLAPYVAGSLVDLAPSLGAPDWPLVRAEAFWNALGRPVQVVHDSPGLVQNRLLACLVNEAAFAVQEAIASEPDIDTAITLGVNYPYGSLAWGDEIGLDRVLATLETLQAEFGDDRYRPAYTLRQRVRVGQTGRRAGRGFHPYTQ